MYGKGWDWDLPLKNIFMTFAFGFWREKNEEKTIYINASSPAIIPMIISFASLLLLILMAAKGEPGMISPNSLFAVSEFKVIGFNE